MPQNTPKATPQTPPQSQHVWGGMLENGVLSIDPGRTRTCNPRLRRPMPYPLGHGAMFLYLWIQWQRKAGPVAVSPFSSAVRVPSLLRGPRGTVWLSPLEGSAAWPVGLMDKASASGAGDSRLESWAGHAIPRQVCQTPCRRFFEYVDRPCRRRGDILGHPLRDSNPQSSD